MLPVELFGRWKLSRAKPIDEDKVVVHLSTYEDEPLCGIHKQYPDVYEMAMSPIEYSLANMNTCCQRCIKVARKRYGW